MDSVESSSGERSSPDAAARGGAKTIAQAGSISVLLPTRNSMALLPGHLDAMEAWIDLAHEVVVVDSGSTDGTRETLQARLEPARTRFFDHPPGLYASWNFGLQQLRGEYAYISTVGDTITRAGVEDLRDALAESRGDVVISKPTFLEMDGRTRAIDWPIDDVIQTLGLDRPRRLSRWEALIFVLAHANAALLGSCASNLFRAEILQRFPFPTGFGANGDGMWGVQHAAEIDWVVTPETVSTFRLHQTSATHSSAPSTHGAPALAEVIDSMLVAQTRAGRLSPNVLRETGVDDVRRAFADWMRHKETFDRLRKGAWPWSLNPRAWSERIQRERGARRLRAAKARALARVADLPR